MVNTQLGAAMVRPLWQQPALAGLAPVPWQQLVQARGGVVGDAGQDVGEPGARVDAVELGGDDE